MRLRQSDRERSNPAERESTAGTSSVSQLIKHLLTAVGVLVFTYAVVRVLGWRDDVPVQSIDEVQDEIADTVSDDHPLVTTQDRTSATVPDSSTNGPRNEAAESGSDIQPSIDSADAKRDDSAEPGDEGGGDVLDASETRADYTDDRSDAEIAERAEPDVQDESAEPGEMAVDEDITTNLVDDDTDAETEPGGEADADSEE